MRRVVLAISVVMSLACAAPAPAALPSAGSGHRPGPDALYAPPPKEVPQLENAAPWAAEPILVSGTQAYQGGEWLYQDFLHDDHGAAGARDPNDPFGPESHLFSPTAGSMTYPTDPVYAHNAADLVELRIAPRPGETAFRVTLNTLKDAERTAFTIALGSSPGPRPWPHGAGVSSPAEMFLTVHGSTAELRDATTGAPRGTATASVDMRRRQVDVRVPHTSWNPGAEKVRVTIGVGLWDPAAGGYLKPAAEATATRPGGATPQGVALFNVGPRFAEPLPKVSEFGAGYTIGDAAAGAAVQASWWREKAQADALRLGDVSGFSAEVDFAKLAARSNDDSGVPSTGPMNRILASRYQFGQGIDPARVCFTISGTAATPGAKCEGRFLGQLQPYAIYVPKKQATRKGYGLTLLLHSLSANYNQYSDSKNQSQFGERDSGSIVVTPAGRGPDGFYAGVPEADTFEVWADVNRHYRLDPDWVAVSGYSMGGFGTFRMLARWPDLFGRGMATVGAPGSVADQLVSLRNTPIMTWNAAADELVNAQTSERMVADMTAAGIRFIHDFFPTADHLTLASNDEYGAAAEFLGEHRADRAPSHVTYVVDPTEDSSQAGAIADHAYWVSGLRVRDSKASPRGTIDARSAAFGYGDSEVLPIESSAGVVEGGSHGPMPYQRRERKWGPVPPLAKTSKLFVKATNVASATFDGTRARVGCAPKLYVTSDGPLELGVTCVAKAPKRAPRCTSRVSLLLPRVAARPNVEVRAIRRGRTLATARGRRVLRIAFRRPTRKAFSVRIVSRAGGTGPPITLASTRAVPRCSR